MSPLLTKLFLPYEKFNTRQNCSTTRAETLKIITG